VDRYGRYSIALHWFMFAVVLAAYACIELRELFPKGSDPREALKTWHYMLGLSVFLVVWLRVAVRVLEPRPAPILGQPRWQTAVASAMHLALYALMVGMPIAGWLLLSAEGKAVPFFGLQLPPLIAENEAAAHRWEEIHETAGTIGYFLIGLHAAAALIHHYVLRDATLKRMLPRRASGSL
jgi:cytochrome b561